MSYAIGFSGFRPRYEGSIVNHPTVRAAREGKSLSELSEIKDTEK
jgi:hypothetical protein